MKLYKKFLAVFLLILLAILSSSCSEFTGVQVAVNQSDEENTQKGTESTSKLKFETIADTHESLDQIGTRLIGTQGNYLLVEELKDYLKKFPEAELVSMPYSIEL